MVKGTCHLCLKSGELTFEHVPPKKAYNNKTIFIHNSLEALTREGYMPWDFTGLHGTQSQKGFGAYTLCPKCNNDTGAWYGSSYIDFVYQGSQAYRSNGIGKKEIIIEYKNIYPLRIVKQILAMLCSINAPSYKFIPEVNDFILNKERMENLSNKFGLYVHIATGTIAKRYGVFATLNGSKITLASELFFPPYGYIIDLQPGNHPEELNIISWANSFKYDDKVDIKMNLKIRESNTGMPLDYRSQDEVVNDIRKNTEYLKSRKNT